MFKKIVFVGFFFIVALGNSQDLEHIRSQYPLAEGSEEITLDLEDQLSKLTSESKSILLAYQGAIKTIKAKFTKKASEKKAFFKAGVSAIENAVKANPENVEIRYIRLTVQENSPKFLGYHKEIEDDKEFILKNYSTITSPSIKNVIKDFVLNLENSDRAEKQ